MDEQRKICPLPDAAAIRMSLDDINDALDELRTLNDCLMDLSLAIEDDISIEVIPWPAEAQPDKAVTTT